MTLYLKMIINKTQRPLTLLILIVGILMSCESTHEEIITKDDKDKVISSYTVRKEDNVKDGKYQLFLEGELIEKGMFSAGKQDGVRILFFANEKVQVEETYDKGRLVSKNTFYKNGNPESEGQYDIEGAMSGEWKYYYSKNGKLKESVHFEGNVESGPFKEFYENGNIKAEGAYVPMDFGLETQGMETGELKEYNENGELVTKKNCENGKCETVWEADKK